MIDLLMIDLLMNILMEELNDQAMVYVHMIHIDPVKACRVLVRYRRSLEAADFLQNVIYINTTLTETESVERFTTLAGLYGELGMRRKEAFCYRIAAMQSVIPSNPVGEDLMSSILLASLSLFV